MQDTLLSIIKTFRFSSVSVDPTTEMESLLLHAL